MSIISSMDVTSGTASAGALTWLADLARRWRDAYVAWCAERAAIALLGRMSDRELKDIGITRSSIPFAVKNGRPEPFSIC